MDGALSRILIRDWCQVLDGAVSLGGSVRGWVRGVGGLAGGKDISPPVAKLNPTQSGVWIGKRKSTTAISTTTKQAVMFQLLFRFFVGNHRLVVRGGSNEHKRQAIITA